MESLADQLKSVKLKKRAEPVRDYSTPKTGGFLSEAEIKDYEKSVLEVNTEKWIDLLKDETFPTILCPFKLEAAKVFINIYERLYLNKDSTVVCNIDWRETLTDEERSCMDELIVDLQKSMDVFCAKGYAFVKTSSRSAKDAPMVQKHFKDLYKQELESHPVENRTENVQITCLLKAAFIALRVKTAEEVVDMFIRSERIYQDLLLACVNQLSLYDEHFVIRQFVDIDVDMEFRGFVYDYNLVALSQYNYAIYSERLAKGKEKYGQMITDYFEKSVRPKLLGSNFPKNSIVDFAICDEGSKIWVIEVNPFYETTDGALFSWNKERDILEGAQGFVFRITEKVRPGAKTILPQSVKNLIDA
ncbi:hypothetical protein ACF0H5_018937 [Mactra antiquata]